MTDNGRSVDNADGLKIKEAAALLHIHEKTVRQRIRTGEIHAVKVPRPQGFEWRVYLNGSAPLQVDSSTPQVSAHMDSPPAHMNGPTTPHVSPPATQVDTAELVRLVERLHNENTQLAGQVGFLQARVQEQERTIARLMAPQEPESAPAVQAEQVQPRRSWWQLLLGRD